MKKLLKKLPAKLSTFNSQFSILQKGFTLIELLIVIAIIAALAIAVFVALNPAQRLKDAKDARRTADADTILTAIHASIVDTKGALPTGLTTSMLETQLGTGVAADCSPVTTGGCSVAASTACVNLATPLAKYLKSMPIDPTGGTTFTALKTGYSVTVDANNIVTIKACGVEGTTNISVSR
ncbi:MAG: prepilin-type N-terminal cleavage/methylation domain-containing protein [Patescibacteria group bacterium]